jgi:hypothetical protein
MNASVSVYLPLHCMNLLVVSLQWLKESPTALDGRGNVRQLIIVTLQDGHVKSASRGMQSILAGHVP